ncbi:tetratricopeptide repeat protein [Winogradskyella haliclonae]|uniref:Tetratricopeptide repeat protein n=1 Tax=Winogradskyella haliclonae TaxID=2048558 RepID=A0ABQ2BXB5_9FLAO|nr:hypothetical protein [Winogradskyella haliclonae]GGI57154.1 hypothetical protein GCM10011444_14630 [Winogradskyella haliclonae]
MIKLNYTNNSCKISTQNNLMKYFILFLFLITIPINAQEVEIKFSKELCKCFDKNYDANDLDLDIIKECFISAYEEIKDDVNDMFLKKVDSSDINNDKAYLMGSDYAGKLMENIHKSIINDCDSYYKFSINLFEEMHTNLVKHSHQKNLDSLTNQISKDPNNAFKLIERGLIYLGKGDINNSKEDLEKSLELNSTVPRVYLYLAMVYDLEGNSDKSIRLLQDSIYKNIDFQNAGYLIIMYHAMLKRKVREK